MAAVRQHWRDAVEAHTEVAHWAASDLGAEFIRARFQHDVDEYRDHPGIVHLIQTVFTAAGYNLPQATPVFVSAEMGMMVEHAALHAVPRFEPEPLYPTDVVVMDGFMYFERPFSIPDRFGRMLEIGAVSWTPIMDPDGPKVEAHRVLTRDDEMREWLEERHKLGLQDGLAVTLWSPTDFEDVAEKWDEVWGGFRPRVVPIHITPWWWGQSFGENDVTIDGRPTGAEHWWKLVQITWRLMQQRIIVHRREQIPRPLRRERSRYGMPPNDCVVVTLRRERDPDKGDGPTGEEAHYSHRFMVKGYWRRQHYKGGITRQIYIADYEKGPADKPLILKPRAYTWTR